MAKTEQPTETMALETAPVSEYVVMDQADADQIVQADSAIRQALCYDVMGKKQISFAGVKWIVLRMSQHGQALTIVSKEAVLEKHDPDDMSTWVWYATVTVRNANTGLETLGVSDSPWQARGRDGNPYDDQFARTKAVMKALRNAWRQQIPEMEIKLMLDAAEGKEVQALHVGSRGGGGGAAQASSASTSATALKARVRKTGAACRCETPVEGRAVTTGDLAGVKICRKCGNLIIREQELVAQ